MSRGIDRERQVRKLLEEDGWWVSRAAGSKGDADLVALQAPREVYTDVGGWQPWHERRSLMVEVKSTAAGPYAHFGPADRAELSAAARQAGAEAWLCWWPPRKQPQWIAESDWPEARVEAA